MAVSSFAPASAGLQQYEAVIESSQVWTRPTGVKTVEVTVVGGGGGSSSFGAGGGGYSKKIIDLSTATAATVTIGAGGTQNSDGGLSSFISNNGLSIYCTGGATLGSQGSEINPTQFGGYNLSAGNQYPGVTGSSYTNTSALIGYGNGKYVMLPFANQSTNYATTDCYYSTNGTSWSLGTTLPTARNFSDVAYGNGIFLAIRPNESATATTVITSSNGINWTESAVTMAGDKLIFANGLFVTSGSNGSSGTSYSSSDGITWTAGTVTRTIVSYETAAWRGRPMWDGQKFTQVHSSGSYPGHVYQSTNGTSWYQVSVTGTSASFSLSAYSDAFYSDGVYLVGENTNSNYLFRSTNGISWSRIILPISNYVKEFIRLGEVYFAVTINTSNSANRLIYSKDKGLSWSILDLKDSAGTVQTAQSIGYLGSIASNESDQVILASDSKFGGGGGGGGGVWKITGQVLIKEGRTTSGLSAGSSAGHGAGGIGDTYGTYVTSPKGGSPAPDGLAAGGHGLNVASGPVTYGSGGSLTYPYQTGKQGVVILRWLA